MVRAALAMAITANPENIRRIPTSKPMAQKSTDQGRVKAERRRAR